MNFFYVPSFEYARKFIETLREVYVSLKDRVNFEPNLVTFSSKSQEFITSNCVSQGKYCAFDPDNDGPITGRDVVLESIRQKCIYKTGTDHYFSYMAKFFDSCINDFTKDCSNKLIKKIGLSSSDIDDCLRGSFHKVNASKYDNENDILAAEKEKVKKLGITNFPNIYINKILYNGTLSPFDLLLSLCSSLNDETQECRNLKLDSETDLNITSILVVFITIFIVCLVVMAYVCKKIAKKRFERDLNIAVDTYVTQYSSINNERRA